MERQNSARAYTRRNVVTAGTVLGALALSGSSLVRKAMADEPTATQSFVPGVYTGSFDGHNGPVTVTATFTADALADIVVEQNESRHIGTEAVKKLVPTYLQSQSLNIDGVSGATVTSAALRLALEDCYAQAGADVDALYKGEAWDIPAAAVDVECDVCVIGTGIAGLCAAVEAAQAGAKVVMLEKMDITGGNSNAAEGQYNSPDPEMQEPQGITDSVDKFFEDTFTGGDETADPDLVRVLADNALDGVHFMQRYGLVYRDEIFTAIGGLWPRAHYVNCVKTGGLGGSYYVTNLLAAAEDLDVRIIEDAKVEELVTENGAVVEARGTRPSSGEPIAVRAGSFVVATGGYARNPELAMEYDARVTPDMLSSNTVSSTGDGIEFGTAAGADLMNMELVQIHPLGDPQSGGVGTYIGIWVGIENFIFVNQEGNRFINEDGRRDEISNALLEQTDRTMYLLVDSSNLFTEDYQGEIDKLIEGGHSVKADSIDELAELIGVPADALQLSIDQYNEAVRTGSDPMGKTVFGSEFSTPPFYASRRVPTLHYCMGGLKIDTNAQVISTQGTPIANLYACGEVTGGVQGSNRLGANSMPDCVVFGRIAGQQAAANALA